MAIFVRPADLDSDRELLIDAFLRYLTPLSDDRRFNWLYRENPHGPARAWVATEGNNRAIVGAAAAFPRRMYIGGIPKQACVLGDFCVSPHYRSLGPALQLQRACLAGVDSGTLALVYDFPSTSMMAVYRRLGVEPCGQMVRLAKPLRAERKIGEKVKVRPVARGLAAVGDFVLELQDRRLHKTNDWTLAIHQGACGEEFSALARQVGGRYGVCVERSAEYLNWRYLAHPHRRHEVLTARRKGALSGYLIYTHAAEDARIVDLFGLEEKEMLAGLVAGLVAILRERGVITLSAPLVAWHPWVALLEDLSFRARESCPVVVYTAARSPAAHGALEGQNCFLMDGDRDS